MKKRFIELYGEYIRRKGSDKLLAWLETTDFFNAPASTKYHLSRPGGLAEHSVHVYERFLNLVEYEKGYSEHFCLHNTSDDETIAICGLLHDICKTNLYDVEMRNRKNEQGQWEQYPFYVVNDRLPYGHGEKSVYIISGFMRLTREEAFTIRWHMGGFDDSVRGGSYALNGAYKKYPLALLLHIADMQATYLDETEEK